MEGLIYKAIAVLFDSSLITNVKSFMEAVINGLTSVFINSSAANYFTIFSAAAASLMIIFFFIDLTDNAAKDMITLERLVLSFIKLLIGFTIMLFLPEIINGLFGIVKAIYNELTELSNSQIDFGVTFWGQDTLPPKEDVDFDGMKGSFGKILAANLISFVVSVVVILVGFAAKFAAYFITISNAITLITRAVFSPIAVAQCFEDGQKSNAVRYLKKFAADGLTFAIILGILYAGSLLQGNIATAILADAGIRNIDGTTALELMSNINLLAAVLVINFSVIGASMKAGAISQDIVGAH